MSSVFRFTHLITASEVGNLTERQLWQGLRLRMLRPQVVLEQVSDSHVTRLDDNYYTRRLCMGGQWLTDRVWVNDPGVTQRSMPGADEAFCLTIQPDCGGLQFSYQRRSLGQQAGVDLNAHVAQAYMEMDRAFISSVMTLADSGELARHHGALEGQGHGPR